MLRAPSPEVVSESTRADIGRGHCAEPGAQVALAARLGVGAGRAAGTVARSLDIRFDASMASPSGCTVTPAAGRTNRASSRLTFASMRSHEYCAFCALERPLLPIANANGMKTPCTSL